MADSDTYLLKPNGKPYRTKAGNRMKLEQFDNEPTYDKSVHEQSDKEFREELERLGIPKPK